MKSFLIFILFVVISKHTIAASSIIVHPSNNASLDTASVAKLYLGKSKSFSTGEKAVPLSRSNKIEDEFVTNVLGKNPVQLKAYWSKRVFTGKGAPPRVITSDTDIKKLISNNPNMIGYIDSKLVDSSVKVIASF